MLKSLHHFPHTRQSSMQWEVSGFHAGPASHSCLGVTQHELQAGSSVYTEGQRGIVHYVASLISDPDENTSVTSTMTTENRFWKGSSHKASPLPTAVLLQWLRFACTNISSSSKKMQNHCLEFFFKKGKYHFTVRLSKQLCDTQKWKAAI